MAVLASPAMEHGYIRTVLSTENFLEQDNSSLALPSEDRLSTGRQDMDRSMRMHSQVQQTLARKGPKKSTGGTIQGYVSVPDHMQHNMSMTMKGTPRSPTQHYNTMKGHQSSMYENGWARTPNQYTLQKYENGWAGGGSSAYAQWGMRYESSQRGPYDRRDISPEREPRLNEYKRNATTSMRYQERKAYPSVRYAFSEFGTTPKNRQSQVKVSNLSDQDSVFVQNGPISPARPLYQQSGHSRSMNNLIESGHYQVQPRPAGASNPAVVNQQQTSNRSEVMKSTIRHHTSYQSTFGPGAYEMGGKRATITAGMAAGVGSGAIHTQPDGGQLATAETMAPVTAEVDMTLERAISLLQNESSTPYLLTAAASFIQHECFQKAEARKRVYTLGGIPKLIRLLSSDNEEVQRASCAALRNLVFEDNDNKLEVYEQRGIPTLLTLLKNTQDLETKRQITGLLWNLSSNDQLKVTLIRDALRTLNTSIIIPYSGWSESEYSKMGLLSDADTFYNATCCLRNMSSAGPEGRKAMRECDGLIDSLVYYTRRSVADHKPDDKATENCVCILHNLSYQLEAELPGHYSHNFHVQSRNQQQSDDTIGCFGARSRKIKEQWNDAPMAEESSNPRGVEWLWHSIVIRMYLSLIATSSRSYTQEASLGCLQNLTAGNGQMPFSVAQMVVQKGNGLQYIRNMLYQSDPGVKRTAVSLLRNLSRNPSLHNEIARELMPDLIKALPDSVPDSNIANDTAASTCYILNNLISQSSQNARMLLQSGGVQKLVELSKSDGNLMTKAGKVASLVLYNLWSHQDLHSAYKKAMYKKADFINPRTSRAYSSL